MHCTNPMEPRIKGWRVAVIAAIVGGIAGAAATKVVAVLGDRAARVTVKAMLCADIDAQVVRLKSRYEEAKPLLDAMLQGGEVINSAAYHEALGYGALLLRSNDLLPTRLGTRLDLLEPKEIRANHVFYAQVALATERYNDFVVLAGLAANKALERAIAARFDIAIQTMDATAARAKQEMRCNAPSS